MAVMLVWELGAGLGRQRTGVAGAPGRRGGAQLGRTSEGEEEDGSWRAAGQVHFGEAAGQV